jgi:hypothetical protein
LLLQPQEEKDAASINHKIAILCSRVTAAFLPVFIILQFLKYVQFSNRDGSQGKKMNPNTASNLIFDRHPFNTGTLLLMVGGAILLVYAVIFIILKIKK